jgi:SAM-dependent methyltransferase
MNEYGPEFFRKYLNVFSDTKQTLTEAAAESWYKDQILNNDATSQESVGWYDGEGSQYKRFAKLLDIGVCEGDSVLDLGCGIGHLYEHIGDKVIYHGVDPNALAIEKAKELYPDATFTEGHVGDVSETFDWALISGIFNVDFPKTEMVETINSVIEKVNKGVAFNMLTGKVNPDPMLETYQPNEIKEIFELHNPKIVEDYDVIDDFTVYIHKT